MADIRVLQRQIQELEAQMAQHRAVGGLVNSDEPARAIKDPRESVTAANAPEEEVGPASAYSEHANVSPSRDVTQPRRGSQQLPQVEPPAPIPDETPVNTGIASPGPNDEGGCEMQVYGATSLLHDHASSAFWTSPKSVETESDTAMKSATQDRLISQAAISAQREAILYTTPSITENIDFDGPSADMAIHLLDLHWNRLHFTYLLTYRPAIMNSLLNNGPYVNKLLLNAIYLQSSLYSNRDGLRLDPQDPQSTGMAFYNRFKVLLTQHIDQPTMPTVVALLLCGACLVPYGKQSAGWVYCGMAYRMMLDLGYHLDIPSFSEHEKKFGLSPTDAEIRRRVYWGAYANDKFQSLYLGRPPAVHISDGNIPREYLDSYEEMAVWRPYTDPLGPQSFNQGVHAYPGRPSYAISTFQCLLQLSIITEQLIGTFYSVKSSRTPQSSLLHVRHEVRSRLDHWNTSLPAYLRFEATKDPTPPPHQVALHTTYWTLVILVEQAFLNRGNFEFTLDDVSREEARRTCVNAAFEIWRLLQAYKSAFTFRHTQYGIFYAAYSAVLVMLQHADEDHNDYIECIRFFWAVLSDYQRGHTRGLKKPFRVLKQLMHRVRSVTHQINVDEPEISAGSRSGISQAVVEPIPGYEAMDLGDLDLWAEPPWPDAMAEESFFMDNALFGFFT